jgi:hypothetical protein
MKLLWRDSAAIDLQQATDVAAVKEIEMPLASLVADSLALPHQRSALVTRSETARRAIDIAVPDRRRD